MDDNILLDIQLMDVVDDKISTGKRYIDYVDEIFIYDDCASLPNYIMCAPQRAVLATTAESGFFVGAFSLFCPAAAHRLQHRRRVFVARIRGFSFSVFTGGSRASCCERCVFFLFWKGVLRFGGTAGVKKARKEQRKAGGTEEGRLSIRFLTRPSARVLLLETGRRWREPCCGLRCWRFCWFV